VTQGSPLHLFYREPYFSLPSLLHFCSCGVPFVGGGRGGLGKLASWQGQKIGNRYADEYRGGMGKVAIYDTDLQKDVPRK